jgi:hypothetical protein
MTARGWIACCALACASSGCFRTVYRNVEPPGADVPSVAMAPRSPAWRSFYLYGWLPHEIVVKAAAECGGADRVREIRTRQTFGQGMTATFASTGGVNVYSPWTAEVVCAGAP